MTATASTWSGAPQHRRTPVVAGETAAQLSEELLTFLFLPGFSLRDTVTEVSGRGVGLDAVQHMVRQLRGAVVLEQTAGEGSRFHLEVPLTLSVVRSLVVEVGGEAYAFPLAISSACAIWRRRHRADRRAPAFLARGPACRPGRRQPVVAAPGGRPPADPEGGGDPRARCGVRRGRRALYRRADPGGVPLDERLGKVQDISAGALLDDGSVVLIVDVEDMLRSVDKLLNTGRLERIARHGDQAVEVARKRMLVVDDSLTVRELQRKLLLNRGYDVAVAVDGMDGWNALRSRTSTC
jgi:two-component system sensor histidine kinase and response regulator WspE